MNSNLVEINKAKDRVVGLIRDRNAIQDRLPLFETAGKGFYLKNTISRFAEIRAIMEKMESEATTEIEDLMKKICP